MLMLNNLTEEQRLSKAVVSIMGNDDYAALSGVLMVGERGIKDDVPTAYTNGRDEYYGREFVAGLTDPQLRFLVLHEVGHKMYRHIHNYQHLAKLDPELTNMAMDYVINIQIMDENKNGFVEWIDGGCLDEKYRGMNTEEVFKLLYEKKQGNTSPQDGDGADSGSPNTTGDGNTAIGEPFDDHDFDGAKEMTEGEKQELEREIDEAIRQGDMVAGKLGNKGARDLGELLEPQVNWREVLREFISSTCAGSDYSTWNKPNRRYIGMDIYMPSGISEKVEELVLAIDTSGSIGRNELSVFLSEIKSICDTVKPSCVRVLYWDTEVCRDEKYETHELDTLVKSTKPRGGGGTNVECVPEYMAEHSIKPQAVIVLTDGYLYGGWGQWTCPVLWTVLDNKTAKPSVGKVVHVKSNNM